MKNKSNVCYMLIILNVYISVCCGNIGIPSLNDIRLTFFKNFDKVYCTFSACCNDRWISKNISGLQYDLSTRLHGQHLVQNTVLAHIKGHAWHSNPTKALVLSFHGLTGVGKNFVSRIIAENLYRDGLNSRFVHLISATKEFPHHDKDMLVKYKDTLKSWIEGNITYCERSMFIFDEVDKLPALLLDVVKPYVDYHEHLGRVNYRKAIFLFLSNEGGTEIGRLIYEHWMSGKPRDSFTLKDVENTILKASLNSKSESGFWHSQLISQHLVTAFIPFLPLEKGHVKKCIRDALIAKKYYSNVRDIPDETVDLVLKELTFYPKEQVYSSTGCKRVSEKVDLVMMDASKYDESHQHTEFDDSDKHTGEL
ncbi:torsin-1A-like [Physella acuta]|uniref:torsin-1A-like n=1 Tax=Physella acuta TaxID=109671 RepID=UPI0027DCED48|nr:torsin-1A-like [Physella acuta]XP_059141081.1 torsin-1A-like [Physella acuta]